MTGAPVIQVILWIQTLTRSECRERIQLLSPSHTRLDVGGYLARGTLHVPLLYAAGSVRELVEIRAMPLMMRLTPQRSSRE